jgi:hypothetical protein
MWHDYALEELIYPELARFPTLREKRLALQRATGARPSRRRTSRESLITWLFSVDLMLILSPWMRYFLFVAFPLLVMVLLVHLARILVTRGQVRGALQRLLLAQGICGCCGYDLTGNTSGVCPECGQPTDRAIAAAEAHTD